MRSDAVLSQISALEIDQAKELPAGPLRFPRGAKCTSLIILGTINGGTESMDKILELWCSWRSSTSRAPSILHDVEDLNIAEADIHEEAKSVHACNGHMLALSQGCQSNYIKYRVNACSSIGEELDTSIWHWPDLVMVLLQETSQLDAIALIGDKLESLQVGHLAGSDAPSFTSVLRSSPKLECIQLDSLVPPPGIDWSCSVSQMSFSTLNLLILPELLAANLPRLSVLRVESLIMRALQDEEATDLSAKLEQCKDALESLPLEFSTEADSGVFLVGSFLDQLHHLVKALQPLQGSKLLSCITCMKMYKTSFSSRSMS